MTKKLSGYLLKNLAIISLIFLQSCNSIPKIYHDCSKINEELQNRYSLFPNLNQDEINKRSKLDVPTYSELRHLSVFSQIIKSIKNAPPNAKLIPIDLRNYQTVNLGNIIISNIDNDLSLNLFLRTSKYSQGFFAIVNFGKNKITIFNPTYSEQLFEKEEINRTDLQDPELVFNLTDSQNLIANMKFNENQKVSILAKNIAQPFRLDLREASNNQINFGQKWIMSVYDISKSHINGGKQTSGYYLYVNNDEVKSMKLNKFSKSKVSCYSNSSGLKFEDTSINGEF